MHITQIEVREVTRKLFNREIGDVTFRRYVYELLRVLSDEELYSLLNKVEGLPGIRITIIRILGEHQ